MLPIAGIPTPLFRGEPLHALFFPVRIEKPQVAGTILRLYGRIGGVVPVFAESTVMDLCDIYLTFRHRLSSLPPVHEADDPVQPVAANEPQDQAHEVIPDNFPFLFCINESSETVHGAPAPFLRLRYQ